MSISTLLHENNACNGICHYSTLSMNKDKNGGGVCEKPNWLIVTKQSVVASRLCFGSKDTQHLVL